MSTTDRTTQPVPAVVPPVIPNREIAAWITAHWPDGGPYTAQHVATALRAAHNLMAYAAHATERGAVDDAAGLVVTLNGLREVAAVTGATAVHVGQVARKLATGGKIRDTRSASALVAQDTALQAAEELTHVRAWVLPDALLRAATTANYLLDTDN